nr:retrovirus-related Pol polyprotein from transposon TNT 1-94 [Tanacetum cinerariifolium]
MSSAEAEYMTLSASSAQVMWMRTQLKDYGFNYNKIPLYCDYQSAIAISCNPVQHSRTKHIHTHYHFLKEQVENGIIELSFVRTEYQLADMFTKALPEDRFKYLVKRIGTVHFGNDQFAPILGYEDLVQGNVTINRVYYVESLNHNLLSVGQFCDADLERRLSHLNFDYINLLSKKDIVIGLAKLKYVKDQLCSSCELSKAKRSSFKSKAVQSPKGRLNLLHMDLCGPMREHKWEEIHLGDCRRLLKIYLDFVS